jgi:ParB-like chromosome segregation protein Spo0J
VAAERAAAVTVAERAMTHGEVMSVAELDDRLGQLRLSSPETEAWLRGSIESEGLRESLVASSGVEKGKLVLVDGFKRARVLRDLGWSEAPVRVVTADAAGCHALLLALNRARRGLRDIEEAWLVRSLCRGCGMRQTGVAELLGRHKSWVCRRLKLAEQLDGAVQDEIRLGLLPASTAREIVRLPRGNQLRVGGAVREHGLSSRQTARLVSALLSATEEARGALLADPLRYVSHEAVVGEPPGPGADPRLSEGGNRIRERLFWLERDARRVVEVCNGHAVTPLGVGEAEVLVPLLRHAAKEAERARRTIRRVIRENMGTHARRTTEAAVRGPAAKGPGRIDPRDQQGDEDVPADRADVAEGGADKAGQRGDGAGAAGAAIPDASRVETRQV